MRDAIILYDKKALDPLNDDIIESKNYSCITEKTLIQLDHENVFVS